MYRFLAKFWFFAMALPIILRASIRVAIIYRRYPLNEVPDKLRAVAPLRVDSLKNPSWLNGCVGKLLWCLPPFGMGPCLKRSLHLLDLWSRCGLRPTLTFGVAKDPSQNRFHAWVNEEAAGPSHQGYHTLWTQ